MSGARVIHLLMIEDSEDDAALIVNRLRRGGIELTYERVETAGAMVAALRSRVPDLVISDCKMPAFNGDDALRLLHGSGLDVPFIVVSGQIGEEAAADLMRAGAKDFALKDDLSRLVAAVERELHEAQDRREREKAREELERQLHQAERLDSLGQLAGGIAHDFNNLLGVITGCAELVIAELQAGHPCLPDVAGITQAADQAAALTRQLLIFSRLQPAQPETLDLNVVITDTASLLHRTLGEDIEFVTRLEPGLDAVTIDRSRLEQVILNLVVNARVAMPDGGRLTIQTAAVGEDGQPGSASGLPPDRIIRMTCTDTGCGMSAEVAQRAFEPFFTTKAVGGGLGLATVYGVVKDAGGTVGIWSEPGAGTRIDMDLPSAGPLARTPASAASAVPYGRGEHVLVVEDNEALGEIARRMLTTAGYQVTVTASRDNALLVMADDNTGLDLLLTDVVMPGIPLRHFLDTVRTSRPGIPVLLMSGYTTDQAGNDQSPCDLPLVTKPFDSTALLRKVRAALDQVS